MKKFLLILIFFSVLFADVLHITSKKFFYNAKELKSVFIGDVNMTEGKDNILADKIEIYFNKNKKPIKFIAKGNVKFVLNNKNSFYKGHCNTLIYNFLTKDILLIGDVFVINPESNESISAQKIKINRKNKTLEVLGGKKPVNIIIKVNK